MSSVDEVAEAVAKEVFALLSVDSATSKDTAKRDHASVPSAGMPWARVKHVFACGNVSRAVVVRAAQRIADAFASIEASGGGGSEGHATVQSCQRRDTVCRIREEACAGVAARLMRKRMHAHQVRFDSANGQCARDVALLSHLCDGEALAPCAIRTHPLACTGRF